MVKITNRGSFDKTFKFLKSTKVKKWYLNTLRRYGQRGVDALTEATPRDTGTTAESWSYEVKETNNGAILYFNNDNAPYGVSVAFLLQYGHATRNGGYVQGIDFINPALKPIFDSIADDIWKEVTSA